VTQRHKYVSAITALVGTFNMSKIVNLLIDKGSTYQHVFSYKDITDDSIISLVGYTGKFDFKAIVGGAALFSGSTITGELTINGAAGTVTMTLTDEQTGAFTFTEGLYDIEIESAAGAKIRLVEGAITIMPEITTS